MWCLLVTKSHYQPDPTILEAAYIEMPRICAVAWAPAGHRAQLAAQGATWERLARSWHPCAWHPGPEENGAGGEAV